MKTVLKIIVAIFWFFWFVVIYASPIIYQEAFTYFFLFVGVYTVSRMFFDYISDAIEKHC